MDSNDTTARFSDEPGDATRKTVGLDDAGAIDDYGAAIDEDVPGIA